ncbi:MAG: hypothetical protein AVDCRST_MAG66-3922, partial [uncultured Pseudonocardia sp.]
PGGGRGPAAGGGARPPGARHRRPRRVRGRPCGRGAAAGARGPARPRPGVPV